MGQPNDMQQTMTQQTHIEIPGIVSFWTDKEPWVFGIIVLLVIGYGFKTQFGGLVKAAGRAIKKLQD